MNNSLTKKEILHCAIYEIKICIACVKSEEKRLKKSNVSFYREFDNYLDMVNRFRSEAVGIIDFLNTLDVINSDKAKLLKKIVSDKFRILIYGGAAA